MNNCCMLVGRIVEIKKDNELVIEIPSIYKNEYGIYEEYLIPIKISSGIAKNINDYCEKGNVIGIKGYIKIENSNIIIIAERVSVLTSKKE